jgi:hypothetical protein
MSGHEVIVIERVNESDGDLTTVHLLNELEHSQPK